MLLPVLPVPRLRFLPAHRFLLPVPQILPLGLAPEIAQGSLRISLDISNTEEEIDYMLEVIPQVVEQLRGMSDDWRKKHCED